MKAVMSVCLILAMATSAVALSLQWENNPPEDQVTTHTIYQSSSASGPFVKIGEVGSCAPPSCSFTLPALSPGIYYFRVTSSNLWGESAPSNIVSTPGQPNSPKNLILVLTLMPDGTASSQLLEVGRFFELYQPR